GAERRGAAAATPAGVKGAHSPLAAACGWRLPALAGPERSVAPTKSWIAALAPILQRVACWSEDRALLAATSRLPDDLAAAAAADWSEAAGLLDQSGDLFVVGRGPGYAAAQEIALKLKETAGLHAEAYSAAELMHGPMTLAGGRFPVLALSQEDVALPGMVELV